MARMYQQCKVHSVCSASALTGPSARQGWPHFNLDVECFTMQQKQTDYSADNESGTGDPKTLDNGWAWVIVAASFAVNAVSHVVKVSFSILYMDWVEYFDSDKGDTGWIGSLFTTTGSFLG